MALSIYINVFLSKNFSSKYCNVGHLTEMPGN